MSPPPEAARARGCTIAAGGEKTCNTSGRYDPMGEGSESEEGEAHFAKGWTSGTGVRASWDVVGKWERRVYFVPGEEECED